MRRGVKRRSREWPAVSAYHCQNIYLYTPPSRYLTVASGETAAPRRRFPKPAATPRRAYTQNERVNPPRFFVSSLLSGSRAGASDGLARRSRGLFGAAPGEPAPSPSRQTRRHHLARGTARSGPDQSRLGAVSRPAPGPAQLRAQSDISGWASARPPPEERSPRLEAVPSPSRVRRRQVQLSAADKQGRRGGPGRGGSLAVTSAVGSLTAAALTVATALRSTGRRHARWR